MKVCFYFIYFAFDVLSSQIQAVVLDSRKEHLVLTAKIMDCRHYSPDTPMEGREDEPRYVTLALGES